MKVLGIIPARGGSKGVPRKNIRSLSGKPLIAHTIEGALEAHLLTRVILSTDDEEIASVGKSFGADVPFIRPSELAADDTPTFPVIVHAVEYLEAKGEVFDAVCILKPTNPFRRSEDIDACIELMAKSAADSVVSVLPVPETYNPMWVYWRNTDGRLSLSTGGDQPVSRRQDLPPAFHRDGTIYVTKRDVLSEYGNLYGNDIRSYVIDAGRSVNIDTEEDWKRAEELIGEQSAFEQAL